MGQYPKLRMNLKKSFYRCIYLCMYNSALALHSNLQRLDRRCIFCCRTKLFPSFQEGSHSIEKIYFCAYTQGRSNNKTPLLLLKENSVFTYANLGQLALKLQQKLVSQTHPHVQFLLTE